MNPARHELIAKVTASHCCVCRAHLTDAESVEHGIGPICSRRYYNPQHVPTEKMVREALGHLQVSGLPDYIIDAFLRLVNDKRRNARKGSNLLVYWASCHYQDREEVFKCSRIIRALGYTELADKLEVDRTVARIENKGSYLLVYTLNRRNLKKDLRLIPGIEPLLDDTEHPRKLGRKIGWKIPVEEKDHLLTVLGVHCGGDMVCSDTGVETVEKKTWRHLLAFRNKASNVEDVSDKSKGCTICLSKAVYKYYSKKVYEVYTPYKVGFKEELKREVPYGQRSWTGKCWIVTQPYLDAVKSLVSKHFGARM